MVGGEGHKHAVQQACMKGQTLQLSGCELEIKKGLRLGAIVCKDCGATAGSDRTHHKESFPLGNEESLKVFIVLLKAHLTDILSTKVEDTPQRAPHWKSLHFGDQETPKIAHGMGG